MSDDLYNWFDADTACVMAAISEQFNYMVYEKGDTEEELGRRVCPAKSKKQWVAANKNLNPDDYLFVKEPSLKPAKYGDSNIKKAQRIFNKKYKDVCAKFPDRKTVIVIDGEGNFRDSIYPNYKGHRNSREEDGSGDIILREELSQWVIDTYPLVHVAEGMEADDVCSIFMAKGYRDYLETGIYTHMASSCDKDLKTNCGMLYNPCTDELLEIDDLEATKFFCYQLLAGDKVDNIKGLNGRPSEDLIKEYGGKKLKKGCNLGEGTAKTIITALETVEECFEAVVRLYKDVHGDDWMDALQEEAGGLRMAHKRSETKEGYYYSIMKELDDRGLCCEYCE